MQVDKRTYLESVLTSGVLPFTEYFFKKRFNRRFIVSEHHRKIAGALDKVLRGEVTRLMINIFPRSGKTEIAVKNFIALGFALNPASKFIHLTYSNDLALDNSEFVRDEFLRNEEYAGIFDFVKINRSSTAKNKWYTTAGGGLYSAAAGGAITGFGAGEVDDVTDSELENLDEFIGSSDETAFSGAVIIDDPLKPDDAFSEIYRNRVNRRWMNTIKSRLNSISTPVVVIGQRLHPDDFFGHILEMEGRAEDGGAWTVLNIPALYVDENNEYRSIWEGKMPVTELLKLKEQDEYTFQSQYQQNPVAEEGMLFPKSELNFYDPALFDLNQADYSLLMIDPADTGDDFVGIYGVYINGFFYVDKIICNNSGLAHNVPASVQIILDNSPSLTKIEANGGWVQTANDIRREVQEKKDDLQVILYKEMSNKEERILSQAYFIKTKMLFRKDYEIVPEYNKAVSRLTSYMKNKKGQRDDVPDVLANIAKHLRANGLLS